jgi:hypothetical protein
MTMIIILNRVLYQVNTRSGDDLVSQATYRKNLQQAHTTMLGLLQHAVTNKQLSLVMLVEYTGKYCVDYQYFV